MERCHAFKKLLIQSPLMESLIGHLGQAYYFRAQPTPWTQMQRHDLQQAASPKATCCRAARGWSGCPAGSQPSIWALPAGSPARSSRSLTASAATEPTPPGQAKCKHTGHSLVGSGVQDTQLAGDGTQWASCSPTSHKPEPHRLGCSPGP